jgi:hypothetical protein
LAVPLRGTNMSQVAIVVGFAEAMAAPEVVWSLVDAGFRVVAFARKGQQSALRHSRYVVCHEICPPEVDIQACLSDLDAILASVGTTGNDVPRVLFPLDDKAVWLANRVDLGNRWLLAGPDGVKAELALNKCVQTQLACDAGFNVPKPLLARGAKDVFAFGAKESLPIILKAAECVPVREGRVQGCRKWICADSDELKRAVDEWAERLPLLVQPFITGTGEGIFGLAAPDGVRAWSGHRRLRMMNPQGSGSSACVSQSVSDDLKTKSEELVRRAGWRGVFMIELLRDAAGKVWFIELNGRPWGSMALSRRQGLEYPAWHVMLAMDEQSSVGMVPLPAPGMVCRNVGREIMHLLFVLRGARSKALRNWPSIWKTMGQVIGVHRGDSYYNWRRDDAKVFFADCYYTIHGNVFKAKN